MSRPTGGAYTVPPTFEVAEHQWCDMGAACPNGPDAVQVYRLGRKTGRRRFPNLSECVSRAEFEAPGWCQVCEHYKWCAHSGGVMGPTGWERP
jgi:hypothetical protein